MRKNIRPVAKRLGIDKLHLPKHIEFFGFTLNTEGSDGRKCTFLHLGGTRHRSATLFGMIAGTTGLEPAASAVTAKSSPVTN